MEQMTLKCTTCGSTHFEYDDLDESTHSIIKCNGCGDVSTRGSIRKQAEKAALNVVEKETKKNLKGLAGNYGAVKITFNNRRPQTGTNLVACLPGARRPLTRQI